MAEQTSQYSNPWFGQWPFSESNVKGFEFCATWLGFDEKVKDPPAVKDLPRLRKDLSQENLEILDEKTEGSGKINNDVPPDGWTATQPYEAEISNAAWLSTPEVGETLASRLEGWGETRRVCTWRSTWVSQA